MSKVKDNLFEIQEASVLNEKQLEALRLHNKILTSGQIAAEALVELSESLKKMRDSKLYVELGYENFSDYCEQKAGIKQRQAYNFISAFENLGKDYLQANAKLGITKLAALASLSDSNREELENKIDVESVSTRELQTKIDELMRKCEQLSLDCEQSENDAESVEKELEETRREKEELERELETLRKKPVEVAVTEPDEKTLNKIRKEAEAKYKEETEKQKKLLKETQERAEKEAEENKKAIEELKNQNLTLQANTKNKASPPLGGNKELLKHFFEEMTGAFNSAIEIVGRLEGEEKEKYVSGFLKIVEEMRGRLESAI